MPSSTNTGTRDAKGRVIWRGPKGGLFVRGEGGKRLAPSRGGSGGRAGSTSTNTGNRNAKGRAILRGPKGGLFVRGEDGRRMAPARGGGGGGAGGGANAKLLQLVTKSKVSEGLRRALDRWTQRSSFHQTFRHPIKLTTDASPDAVRVTCTLISTDDDDVRDENDVPRVSCIVEVEYEKGWGNYDEVVRVVGEIQYDREGLVRITNFQTMPVFDERFKAVRPTLTSRLRSAFAEYNKAPLHGPPELWDYLARSASRMPKWGRPG